ncbi:ABC transporter substrate-binding protein [Pseudomonas aegrilactucae]|uniref:ABC transporter substrate-binding protein n=1 Tax=Pseudomonas aegrilactucae TaxID=2854028 RepID=A0A9Q2XGY2_9PSED|nr:ABC transporter substrate-binding protein [Pseudomonas aegrilactucae]MBV6286120.1 ABC transporter substrate-binding protein [Pseudomonas aegrilactucae]
MTLITRLARLAVLGSVMALGACKPADELPHASRSTLDGVLRDGSVSYAAEDFREASPGKPGGTLRVTTALDTTTLDVHSISHGNVQWLGRILFDCLLYQDEQGNISPWLAKSWEISPDGLTYTFHLRDDVTFSDGEKFNARAVQVNLEHMRDPATKSPLAAAYIAPYVDGRIVDEYTFEARLREPYSPFLDVLAQSWLSMLSPRQILQAPKSIAEHPIGTGPFVLESYTREQSLTFVKRKGYHWAPAVTRHSGEAYLDRIELSIIPEPMIRFSALESGQSDFTVDAPAQNAKAIRANPDLRMHSRIRKANPFRSMVFNVERFPFQDVQVRRAVAKAIDREGLTWITGFGEYQAKGDFLAANTRYYDPAFKDVLGYDPAEANRLLDEAGWAQRDTDGYRVKDGQRLAARLVTYETGAYPSSVGVAIQADLKKIGFELTIDLMPLAQFTQYRYSSNFQLLAGGYWHTNTPDGLYILYHSNAISTPKLIGQNAGRFRDAPLDAALSAARRSTDPAELAALYRTAQQRLVETVPAIPVFEAHVVVAYRKAVKGVIFDTSHNTPFFTSVWLDPEVQ